MNTFTLFGTQYRVQQSQEQYSNNKAQPILDLFRCEDGMPSGRMTTCIPGVKLEAQETILKDEFAAFIEDLEEAKIVVYSGKFARSGHANYPIVTFIGNKQ